MKVMTEAFLKFQSVVPMFKTIASLDWMAVLGLTDLTGGWLGPHTAQVDLA